MILREYIIISPYIMGSADCIPQFGDIDNLPYAEPENYMA